MTTNDTALLAQYIPWSNVRLYLGLNEEAARKQVDRKNVRRIKNPYARGTFLYNKDDLKRVKLARTAFFKKYPNFLLHRPNISGKTRA